MLARRNGDAVEDVNYEKSTGMRRILVAGNWKMHGSKAMVGVACLTGLLASSSADSAADLAVFPSFPYLSQAAVDTFRHPYKMGWTNPEPESPGCPYRRNQRSDVGTDMACHYVLVGHSETTFAIYNESDADVAVNDSAQHWRQAWSQFFVLAKHCEEREAGQTEAVVGRQLDAVLNAAEY